MFRGYVGFGEGNPVEKNIYIFPHDPLPAYTPNRALETERLVTEPKKSCLLNPKVA